MTRVLIQGFEISHLVTCQSVSIYQHPPMSDPFLPDRSLFSSWPMRKNNPGVELCHGAIALQQIACANPF